MEMPVLTNLKFNPNKVYTANVNHLKELQMIKQKEEDMKKHQNFQGYAPMYPVPQGVYYPNSMQPHMVFAEPQPISYYQNMYPNEQTQYYSPQWSSPAYYQPQIQMVNTTTKKPSSKLSTKSPHAITGHKLTRRNTTSYTPQSLQNTLIDNNQPTTPQNGCQVTKNDNFSNISQQTQMQVPSYQGNRISWQDQVTKMSPDPSEFNNKYVRKSTYDDSESNPFQQSISSMSSPEEQNMCQRIMANFKLNPFPIENEEDQYDQEPDNDYGNYDQSRMNRLYEAMEDEDHMFSVFEPCDSDAMKNSNYMFPAPSQTNQDPFQKEGPIFRIISKTEANGATN